MMNNECSTKFHDTIKLQSEIDIDENSTADDIEDDNEEFLMILEDEQEKPIFEKTTTWPEHRLKCGEIIVFIKNRKLYYTCEFCEKSFSCSEPFLRHVLNVHLNMNHDEEQALLQEATNANTMSMEKRHLENSSKHSEETQKDRKHIVKFDPEDFEEHLEESLEEQQQNDFVEYLSDDSSNLEQTNVANNSEDYDYLELEQLDDILENIDTKNTTNIFEQNDYKFEIELLNDKDEEEHKKSIDNVKTNSFVDFKQSARKTLTKTKNVHMQHICQVCKKSYKSAPLLAAHMKRHLTLKAYACEYCDARFADNSNLKVHTNRHLGIKPHACTQCDMCFASTSELKLHMRSHTGERPYVCEQCGKSFANSGHLRAHRRRHFNERPYACVTCGKDFYDRRLLRAHEASHSTARPFECITCGTTFTRQKALAEHAKLHSGIKNYACKLCDRTFAQNAGLWSHMKQHHAPK